MADLARRDGAGNHPAKKAAPHKAAKKVAKKAAAKKATKKAAPHKAAKKAAKKTAKKAEPHKAAKKAAKKGSKKAAKKAAPWSAASSTDSTEDPKMGLRELTAPPTDPREILGLSPDFTLRDLRAAWRTFAARHHPDQGGDAATFVRGRQAYETLLLDKR